MRTMSRHLVQVALATLVGVVAISAPGAEALFFWKSSPLVQMFSGPAAAAERTATQEAMLEVGGEMLSNYMASDPFRDTIESFITPAVDNFMHNAVRPWEGVVTAITDDENATDKYIADVDVAVTDAIESTFLHPEAAGETLQHLQEEIVAPVVDVTQSGVGEVRETLVQRFDRAVEAVTAPIRPITQLMGKQEDLDAWILAMDESIENVVKLQPVSEEVQALENFRQTLMRPYLARQEAAANRIDQDIQSIDGSTSAAGATGESVLGDGEDAQPSTWLDYYQRFLDVRNAKRSESPSSLDQMLAAQMQDVKDVPNKHRLNVASAQVQKSFGKVMPDLVRINPTFLYKYPHWLVTTVAKMREDHPELSDDEISAAIMDLLRMKRMKRQARTLANNGCNSDQIATTLKEFWIDDAPIKIKDVQC